MSKNVLSLNIEKVENDPDTDPDQCQNLIKLSLGHAQLTQGEFHENMSTAFWLTLFNDRQTDKPTKVKTLPPSVEVIKLQQLHWRETSESFCFYKMSRNSRTKSLGRPPNQVTMRLSLDVTWTLENQPMT